MEIKPRNKSVLFFLLYACMFMIALVYTICEKFKIETFEQILFHLAQPMDTGASVFVRKIAVNTAWESVAAFLLMLFIMAFIHEKTVKTGEKLSFKSVFTRNDAVYMKILFWSVCVWIAFMVVFSMIRLKGFEYAVNLFRQPSRYYEEKYVYPTERNIKFVKKNNLILIHLESIEKSYYNRAVFDEVLMPNLRDMSEKHQSFSGYKQVVGTGWTIAGMFAAYCGAPLKEVTSQNNYGRFKSFFSNIKCLPEILKENGYRTKYLQGADLPFAGKDKFLSQHGFDDIKGMHELFPRGDFKQEYKGDWGMNDLGLYEYAKMMIKETARKKGPFLFTMLTINTHFPYGYLDRECPDKFGNRFKNILAHSDALLKDFIDWVQKQDFYKDTTIIMMGDHLSMPNLIYDTLSRDKNREVANVFINSVKKTDKKDRMFCALDWMPTIIEAIGGEVKGGRLGLGTSLFSGKKTLLEEEGFDAFNENIYAKSLMYEGFR